jgi:hypothetical protein
VAQNLVAYQSGTNELAVPAKLGETALALVVDDDIEQALAVLGQAADLELPANNRGEDGLSAAAGALHRVLAQMSTFEQYELLHKWSMPTDDRKSVRLLISLVPETAPPKEFAQALRERPKDSSFSVASVGDMPGIFCSAWTMITAADDAGSLRRLITELEALATDKVPNAEFVLTLARIRDSRSDDNQLSQILAGRVSAEGDVPIPAERADAVLVAAALQRESLGPVCEQIVERLNQFDFSSGTSSFVPFLRRLRATVILKNRSPETKPRDLFYNTPQLWIAADNQTRSGLASGADQAIWLTHEAHVKRLAGSGDDLLLLRYPLAGQFELKGELAELEHGGGGMTFGGMAFDANEQQFTVKEAGRLYSVSRVWPFVASKAHRLFNRVNIRSDGETVTFLSNLHPGFRQPMAMCQNFPWLGLRAFGDGRAIFRNLELVGDPTIPREVQLSAGPDLRGWTSTYDQPLARILEPFPHNPQPVLVDPGNPAWSVADGVIQAQASGESDAEGVAAGHLAYMRPILDTETITYEFFYEEDKTIVHPTVGRLAFLIEPRGVRLRWLTKAHEWTGLPDDNAILEPLNRRGPRSLPLKSGEWNTMAVTLTGDNLSLSLNGEEIYLKSVAEVTGRHFGLYHDRNKSSVQVRNVVLTGDWPETLSVEQMGNLVAF